MPYVGIYAHRNPESFTADDNTCIDIIVAMTGISTEKATEYLARAWVAGSLSVIGPFELFIAYNDDNDPALVLHHQHPRQEIDGASVHHRAAP